MGVVGLVAAGAVAALGTIYLGLPDVAATTPHWTITEWMLSTTMENAVRRRAADLAVPADLEDPARIRAGASAYDGMCVGCHAAPGVEAGVVAEGLLPPPPELAEEAGHWEDAELFWITKHGIRMTGMAAFGPTHADAEIWDVVALLRRLPELSPAEYRSLSGRAGERGSRPGSGHGLGDHGESGHSH